MSFASRSQQTASSTYTCKLFFYDEVHLVDGGVEVSMRNERLQQALGIMVDRTEIIREVMYYALSFEQFWNLWGVLGFSHSFIVFKTDQWWWSIEKNDAGVTVQRSANIESVRDKYQRRRRGTGLTGIRLEHAERNLSASGSRNIITVNSLIDHIYTSNYLNEEYGISSHNCTDFAERIYRFLTTE
jgi:hypothetical protein